ncbi:LysR family transcriptional regulator [Saccharopolyspora sp. HNM0983]|uniref:LysR family transcriptional regulator n=1 Tax=Saccharopolyspora montiporae TaxID=2781240 RepID=A0A929B9Y9_9PSEU|nr:LysR substrate-binding domain-containing protein [Saccharopolyspora sp. HNM0983]MBE9373863.1 LysR family transcriptional regulator [Saccharopolyspora sp. HNM0983]
MELRHLRYFVAVAEERHFGRAAARLHVTQSTLSTQVRGLEREVGGPLFARTSRRVELTGSGEALLVEAHRALDQADRALTVARQSASGDLGSVRLGFSGVAALEGVLSEDLREFRRAHPRVEVELTELPPAAQVRGVREGTIDVGYAPDLELGDVHDLTLTPRTQTPVSVAVRHDHALTATSSVDTADLAGEDLIVYAAGEDDETVLARLGSHGRDAGARIHRLASTLSVLSLASAGAGVALVPAATERIALPGIAYRPVRDTVSALTVVTVSRPDETSGPVRAYLGGRRQPSRDRQNAG